MPIEWYASTSPFLTMMPMLAAYCLNSQAMNCLPASAVTRSGGPRSVSIQHESS